MTISPYAYENRTSILPISWNDFHGLCKGLVQAVAGFSPEIILAVGRGGYYPGTLIAHMLRVELYPVRLTRRVNDVVVRKKPKWLVRPPHMVADKRVLVVDEISSTGETLLTVKRLAEKLGAADVRCAVMYAHSWGGDVPDYIGLISDALILNPWDREIFVDGEFKYHPEYAEAMAAQGIAATADLLIGAEAVKVAKG
ncbi:MAG: phosphoribosyltransferase family protein [Anaerolineae bacterium]